MPQIGDVEDGYRFKGGNPADKNSWEPAENGQMTEAYEFARRPDALVGLEEAGAGMPAMESFTMGYAGEIGGGIKAATDWLAAKAQGKDIPYSDLYQANRDIMEQQLKDYAAENPMTSMAATVAGAIPAAMMMPAARTLPGMMKQGVLLGGITGGGVAETMEDIPAEAAKGALLGTAIPPIMTGGMKAAQGVGRVATGTAQRAANLLTQTDDAAARPALKAVQRAFKRDGISLDEATRKMQELGPDAVMADVGGKNVKALAEQVAQLPGKSADIAENTLQSRMAGSTPRLLSALNKSLGVKTTAYKAGKDIIARRAQQAGPLYDAANSQTVSPQKIDALVANLDDLANIGAGTDTGRAVKAVRNSLVRKVHGKTMPKVAIKELHMAKQDLDSKIGRAIGANDRPLAAELMKIKTSLLEVMDDIPEYKQAREIFASDSSVLSSVELGKKILRTDAEEMADITSGLSKADMDGYILGASKAIADKIKTSGMTANSANRISTHIVRERIRNAFPSDEAFESFMKQVDAENTFAELRNVATRGSQTYGRLGTGGELAIDAAADMARGSFIGTTMNMVGKFFKGLKTIPEPVRDDIGELLFSDLAKHGKVSNQLMRRMAKYDITRQQIDDLIMEINKTAAPASVIGATVTTND